MRTVGALKLPDEDAARYAASLENYGFERSSAFLRRCAYALMKHAETGEKLVIPLDFEVARNQKSAAFSSQ
jgi:hypothetical protein